MISEICNAIMFIYLLIITKTKKSFIHKLKDNMQNISKA